MKYIDRVTPALVGWLAYYAFKTTFSLVGIWLIYFLFPRFFPDLPGALYSIVLVGVYALWGFLGFFASAKWIVLPLLKRRNMISQEPGTKILFGQWLFLGVCVFLYGRLPMQLLGMFSIDKSIMDVIDFVWTAVVSFFVYKDIFSGYVFTLDENLAEDISRSPTVS